MNNGDVYKESIAGLLKKTDDIEFKIRVLKDKNEKLTADNNKEIDGLLKEWTETEATMEKTLTKSGEDAINPKCGWAHFLAMKDKLIYTDKTIPEIESKYPDDKDKYIKTEIKKSLKLTPLKKDIESGEIELEEMTKEPQEKKFEYKYTG